MNKKFNSFYHKFLSTFLLVLLFYIFFFWGVGIIYPLDYILFDSVIFNLGYIFLISVSSVFVVGILAQILINFRYYQYSFEDCKLLLKTNWLVLLTWLLNLIILTLTLYNNFQYYINLIDSQHFEPLPYLILLNLCYIFYIIIGMSLLLTIALVVVYWFYLKKINFFVSLKNGEIYQQLFDVNAEPEPFWEVIWFLNQLPIFVVVKLLIRKTILKDQLRKTKLLIQFKKECCPPLLVG
ncbi:hypothetical protein [Spiroplasma sp. SV19]|uniref:hypothetical protein n=1 Tax=Spiroplasma sp. SV19 TaxID=2570468 RepID=UPI0024B7298F|nr:hypothetical protein [Spiroplasma sp. SV19]WHQ37549.1 hypothetical protein E7Y35_06880 [Spiroplasma sp. SV19]